MRLSSLKLNPFSNRNSDARLGDGLLDLSELFASDFGQSGSSLVRGKGGEMFLSPSHTDSTYASTSPSFFTEFSSAGSLTLYADLRTSTASPTNSGLGSKPSPVKGPKPKPVVDPAPEPEPAPEPDTIVDVTPEPEPQPEPVVDPVVDVAPEPEPEPVVDVTPEPEPQPELVVDVVPEPEPEPVVDVTPEPEPEPVVDAAPEPTPAPAPTPPPTDAQEGDGQQQASGPRPIPATSLDGGGTLSVSGGRVTTFEVPDAAEVTSIEITTLPSNGNITVNPDNTLALVLSGSDFSGPLSFEYSVTRADGTTSSHTVELNVAPSTQQAGWGLGNHYMLETDANDRIVVEHGDNHRKVYVSGSEDALTRADIAAIEGLSESQITAKWLVDHPDYGGSEGMALAADVAMEVWSSITAASQGPVSHWLLFESGYDYGQPTGRLVQTGSMGESELHPQYITSWGEGTRPVVNPGLTTGAQNVVFSDLAITGGVIVMDSENVIVANIDAYSSGVNIRNVENFTFLNSEVSHAVSSEPAEGEIWDNRTQGFFAYGVDGLLIDNNIFHHNSWQDNYNSDGSATGGGGMPPSSFSQNVYLQFNTTDVTFRDNIVSQGAGSGLQARGGAFIEGNLFLDNNSAASTGGGNHKDQGWVGNFSLVVDNVITSAGYKTVDRAQGSTSWGLGNKALDTVWLNNIITHLANPDDPDEQAWKEIARAGLQPTGTNTYDGVSYQGSILYDNTVVFNWQGSVSSDALSADRNLDGVDIALAMQTTIQRYAAELLGLDLSTITSGEQVTDANGVDTYYRSALVTELMDYLLAQRDAGIIYSVSDIIAYFQNGFGIAPNGDGSAVTHLFIPNDLGDGVRWDNKLNWDNNEVPDDGDNVDLGGNWVNYAGTMHLNDLDLGSGGKLQVGQGKLTVDGALEVGDNGGALFVSGAGQFWTDGYDDADLLNVEVAGGRFANTGEISGQIVMNVTGGQTLLAVDDASFSIGAQSELRIDGAGSKVGFDGAQNGVATLTMSEAGQLSFVAQADGVSGLREFRSGAFDQAGSNVKSGVAMDGTLSVDLSQYIGAADITLIEVDALAGEWDDVEIYGLDADKDATFEVDYITDTVTLRLHSFGSGQISMSVIGDKLDGSGEDAALWSELSAAVDHTDTTATEIQIFESVLEPLPDLSFI